MIKNILIILETFLLILFIPPLFHGILNPGNAAGILFSLILLCITFFYNGFKILCKNIFSHTGGKILLSSISVLTAAGIIYCIILSCFMINSQLKSPENAKAIVVLGCKVNGETPSRMLARRLDSAYDFIEKNDNVICIVSGGKGDDEKIPEALAMKNYLVEKGIDPDKIIMEDKSCNTYENMKFSAEILKAYDINEIAIVTDGFHQYRAGLIAQKYGLSSSAVNAKNDKITRSFIPTYWVREWMAITKEYLFT